MINTTTVASTPYAIASSGLSGLSGMSSSAVTFNNTVTAPGGVITDVDSITSKQLDSVVFDTPVQALADLWVARYGDEWIDLDVLLGEEFYALVYKRLKSLGQLETHYLTDRARFVCRKPT